MKKKEFPFSGNDGGEWIAKITVISLRDREGLLTNSRISVVFRRCGPSVHIVKGRATVFFARRPSVTKECGLGSTDKYYLGGCALLDFPLPAEEFLIYFSVKYKKPRPVGVLDANTFPVGEDAAMSADFEELFISGRGSDISFIVGGELILAHKAVLLARAPYFDSMVLSRDRSNNNENDNNNNNNMRVINYITVNGVSGPDNRITAFKIDDFGAAAFKGILKYIYCGKLPENLEENEAEILRAARKYGLRRLEDACLRRMDDRLKNWG